MEAKDSHIEILGRNSSHRLVLQCGPTAAGPSKNYIIKAIQSVPSIAQRAFEAKAVNAIVESCGVGLPCAGFIHEEVVAA